MLCYVIWVYKITGTLCTKIGSQGKVENHKGMLEQSWITWDHRLDKVANKKYVEDCKETETDITQNEGETNFFCISGIST